MEFDIGNGTMASQVIYDEYNVKVTMFNVDHYPVYPAVGYKFEYKGRSLVISGDTVYNENLEVQSTSVDLLICEALDPELVSMMEDQGDNLGNTGEVILHDIQDYHMTPEQAAEYCRKCQSRLSSILSHDSSHSELWLCKKGIFGGCTQNF